MHSILHRAVRHAMARDEIQRDVVALCEVPTGRLGRPWKSLTFDQAAALLTAAEWFPLHATFDARSATWSQRRAWTHESGRRGSYGTASCPRCRRRVSGSRTSPGSLDTAPRG
jgi:hypothetical protein